MGQAQAKTNTGARKLPYVGAITEGVREVLLEQDNAFVAGEDVGPGRQRLRLLPRSSRNSAATASSTRRFPRKASSVSASAPPRPAAADRRHHVHGLPRRVHGRSREPDGEDALHVRRQRDVADHRADDVGRRCEPRGATLAELEAWFAHLPGLKVVMPATPYDVKGLHHRRRARRQSGVRRDEQDVARLDRRGAGEARTKCRSASRTSCDPAPTTRSSRSAGCCTRR